MTVPVVRQQKSSPIIFLVMSKPVATTTHNYTSNSNTHKIKNRACLVTKTPKTRKADVTARNRPYPVDALKTLMAQQGS